METKQCQFCKEEINASAKRCPKCQGDLRPWIQRHKILTTIGGIFLLFIIFGIISRDLAKRTPQANISRGDTAFLRVSGQDDVLVATTEKNLDALVHSAVSKDSYGMAEMVLDGRAFYVDSGTKVLVIGLSGGWTTANVRILEGKNYGDSGWVPIEFVSAQ